MSRFCRYAFLVCALCLLAACGADEYHYPSVKMEFLTARSGADGSLRSVTTDAGETYAVLTDASGLHITPDSLVRIVSNYAVEQTSDGGQGAVLYALTQAIAPLPKPADWFEGGVKTEPADVTSIWMGHDYLNLVLAVKQQGKHALGFVEDEVTDDGEGGRTVRLTFYHDVSSDVQDYTKRAYVSVPLWHYAAPGVNRVKLFFSLQTQKEGMKTYAFEYVPEAGAE